MMLRSGNDLRGGGNSDRDAVYVRQMAQVLRSHFQWADKDLGCETVRMYLPSMASGKLNLRIPTPLTAHLDQCKACRGDLEALRGLALDFERSVRLTEMRNASGGDEGGLCAAAATAIPAVAAGRLPGIPPAILRHVGICPVCRRAVYINRERMLDELQRAGGVPCSVPDQPDCVGTGLIFDLAAPWAATRTGEVDAAALEHISKCGSCLRRVQTAHQTVSDFLEHRESAVATRFHLLSDQELQSDAHSADYFGYPIRVGVARLRAGLGCLSRRVLIRAGAAVAAVVAIAGGLVVLSLNTAQAVSLEAVYRAIHEARNVYVAGFEAGHDNPIQEQWVSREMGLRLLKTGDQLTLWDSAAGARTWREGPEDAVRTSMVDRDTADGIKASIEGSLGLVPFAEFTGVPAGAVWRRLGAEAGREVYELSWDVQVDPTITVLSKWRLYVDMASLIPVRVESYRKRPHDADFVPATVVVARPLTSAEMRDALTLSGLWKGQ